MIASVLNRKPIRLVRYAPKVPPELEWIVEKTLRKDREERYQTARELLTDLKSLKRRLEFVEEMDLRKEDRQLSAPTGLDQPATRALSGLKSRIPTTQPNRLSRHFAARLHFCRSGYGLLQRRNLRKHDFICSYRSCESWRGALCRAIETCKSRLAKLPTSWACVQC